MKKLLIIDDDKAILEIMQMVLVGEGYEVKIITDGEKGCSEVHTYQPDLVVLDLFLPLKDGGEVCRNLKENEATRNIPILMFSAHPMAEDLAKENGADGFISKPFDIQEFLNEIKKLI